VGNLSDIKLSVNAGLEISSFLIAQSC
jgi:hypothetical protein